MICIRTNGRCCISILLLTTIFRLISDSQGFHLLFQLHTQHTTTYKVANTARNGQQTNLLQQHRSFIQQQQYQFCSSCCHRTTPTTTAISMRKDEESTTDTSRNDNHRLPNTAADDDTHQKQTIVLIGGGHAHVQVIRAMQYSTAYNVYVIDAMTAVTYSGMVPGCISGAYTVPETQIPLRALTTNSHVTFLHGRVVDIDFVKKQILYKPIVADQTTADDESLQRLPYDVVSLDIGSTSRGYTTCPGATSYAIPTRPIDQLVQRINEKVTLKKQQEQNQQQSSNGASASLVVVGGGAAGLELAMAVTGRWRKEGLLPATTETTTPAAIVVDSSSKLLPYEESSVVRDTICNELQQKNIDVVYNCRVVEITKSHVVVVVTENSTEQLRRIPYTTCLWATGASAQPLVYTLHNHGGLDIDTNGWITVHSTLQSTSHPDVFAAGDCNTIVSSTVLSPPKAGVYAVRSGPILIQNLILYLQQQQRAAAVDDGTSAAASNELVVYEPQDDFLKLIITGDDRRAIGFRFGIVFVGTWVYKLKHDIDTKFMSLFTKLDDADIHATVATNNTTKFDTSQYDDDDDTDVVVLPTAVQAAKLLLSHHHEDEDSTIQIITRVLRTMASNCTYKQDVLQEYHAARRNSDAGRVKST